MGGIKLIDGGKKVQVECWMGKRKDLARIKTIASHINNMCTGVTRGYQYKMRLVHAHFPIIASIEDGGKHVNIKNFLGEKIVRKIVMREGVSISLTEDVKGELVLEGNSIDNVSQTAANITQCVRIHDKDIRKFLDGIYVSEKGHIE